MTLTKPNLLPLLEKLASQLEGELRFDRLTKAIYATDASVYREIPLAVAFPKTEKDIVVLIDFARANQTSLIPRTAGTSLAGQCVGNGIVVDVSKHFTKILEFNKEERWVRVQPGVVRDELNRFLKPHGLFFSPITSTANRAMIGGMVGNNSSGTTSIVYGVTRDKVISLDTILSDGRKVVFGEISKEDFDKKCGQNDREGEIYRQILSELGDPEVREEIHAQFPKKSIHRRNTGYAVDELLKAEIFEGAEKFNFCKLLAGSEGTLAFTTEIKIALDPLPDPVEIVVAAHFESIHQSMKSAQVAMKHPATAVELMDKIILDCTKESIEYSKNRYFVEGDPAALLMVEFRGKTLEEAMAKGEALIADLKAGGYGYAYPIIGPDKTASAWALRAAGLGLLGNIPGDPKAVACIEDTAVDIADLADYIDELDETLKGFGQEQVVHYAHAGAGEIHIRPILDLKNAADVEEFFKISEASAKLVKKYNGSLSGEHGDGRVRAPFIPIMVGEKNYQLFRRIKYTWDPDNIFNPGKIVDTAPMNQFLRYEPGMKTPEPETVLDFSGVGGILRLAEKCNGSGDCRKLPGSGGTMCPSYMATRNERDTVRGRANTLREFLTLDKKENAFDHPEIKEALDLCLSCKGCTAECPSNVDMASMKAEFLFQYQKTHGVPLRSKAFAYINELNELGSKVPAIANFFLGNPLTGGLMKKVLNVAPQRQLPEISPVSLRKWYRHQYAALPGAPKVIKSVYFFVDEFTNHNDTQIGIKAISLLKKLGYEVKVVDHEESGRSALSKGLLVKAKKHAEANVRIFEKLIDGNTPLIGLEPSAILSFRDEYPRIVGPELVAAAKKLKFHVQLIDEFLGKEVAAGNIKPESFNTVAKKIKLHGHCHQKALSSLTWTQKILSLPANFTVETIPSGCCGMAGSFGYEAEHFEVSQQVGELVLFPAVRKADADILIAAPGTSCRHQIADGTGRKALHPVEILWEAVEGK
jgi:FAD/FMN-containing dehydrogenase/Fe-S oxidoreductase